MTLTAFYERRKENGPIAFDDRRLNQRRNQVQLVSEERRRLASQVRRYEREAFKIPVCLKVRDKEISGFTHNICPNGLLVFTDSVLRAGTPMTLQFSFGDNVCYLNIVGQVVFCLSPESEGGSLGQAIGIQFSAIREFERKILASAVEDLRQNPATQEKSLLNIFVAVDHLAHEAAGFSIQAPGTMVEMPRTLRRASVHASKIIGWGAYHPQGEVTAEEITARVHYGEHKNVGQVVEALTGIKSRRYDSSNRFPSDLAAEASRAALRSAGIAASDLDVIIFCGISRDFDEPATANVLQEKLGATKSYVFDIGNACNGFVTAIDLLDSLIASGRCETGLVATGELISPYIDWKPRSKEDFKHSIFGYTIGDAGGAAVLTRINHGEDRGIRARWFLNDGSYWRLAIAGSMEGANPFDKFFKSKGVDLELASIKCTPAGIGEILGLLQWSIDDVDLVIPHQIPVSIQQNLYNKALGIPDEKLFWTFPQYGNNATASMPVAVCEALKEGRVKEGDRVLLLGAAAGFSAGIVGIVF
ncbi:MAG TPA: 3-oxoacyl-[acyl-carrier-protein] synthase III C-terminal domain-containing protein [Patescibacteria group bacterium]|nr:3-oxoacyl-[acyl-carrier-protein] synthase III C-terminal domain-containing protein [Patescibacteria group bacterium]